LRPRRGKRGGEILKARSKSAEYAKQVYLVRADKQPDVITSVVTPPVLEIANDNASLGSGVK
jgi:hypothetical protein